MKPNKTLNKGGGEKMNHNCDHCGRLGDSVQIIVLSYTRRWKFWEKYHVTRKFCSFGCLDKYWQENITKS